MRYGRAGVNRLLEEANQIANAWSDKPTMMLGEMTFEQFTAVIAELTGIHKILEETLTDAIVQRNRQYNSAKKLAEFVTRARSGFRASFGPDSAEYEQVGGTRTSLRKPISRDGNSDNGAVVQSATSTNP